jgi:hypothetical protein
VAATARPHQHFNPTVFTLRVVINVKHNDSSMPSAWGNSITVRVVIEEGHQSTAYEGLFQITEDRWDLADCRAVFQHKSRHDTAGIDRAGIDRAIRIAVLPALTPAAAEHALELLRRFDTVSRAADLTEILAEGAVTRPAQIAPG